MKDINVLLVPDVHGRSFWKESVKDILENYPDARVVFLGDYLDPYNDELEEVSSKEAFVMFSEEIHLSGVFQDLPRGRSPDKEGRNGSSGRYQCVWRIFR